MAVGPDLGPDLGLDLRPDLDLTWDLDLDLSLTKTSGYVKCVDNIMLRILFPRSHICNKIDVFQVYKRRGK